MNSKSKFAAIALLTAVGLATPAFAQGRRTCTAANTCGWSSPQANAISGGSSGLRAFARVPRAHVRSGLHAFARVPRAHVRSGRRAFDMVPGAAFDSNNPSATGGGSAGYNSYNGRDS